jgi:hypothetical protein
MTGDIARFQPDDHTTVVHMWLVRERMGPIEFTIEPGSMAKPRRVTLPANQQAFLLRTSMVNVIEFTVSASIAGGRP